MLIYISRLRPETICLSDVQPRSLQNQTPVLLALCMLPLQCTQVLTAARMTAAHVPGSQQVLWECSLNEMFTQDTVGFLNRVATAC